MFDIGGLELLVIAVVMIVVVGPKDLPRMLRTFGRVTGQMRRMAGDFRRQFDDALREAEMEELRNTVNDVKSLDPREDIRKAMNPIRSVGDEIRSSLKAAATAPEPTVARPDAPAAPMPDPEPAEPAPAAKPIHMNGSGHPLPADGPQDGGRSST
ncbi:Sec-independent protein translocase protein TatB [Aureimonas sp. AU4]|uniref:Sec-independent protein translocase protein TatB n=1 Tax=Aureimonas sp. AU4 TaxID=1638163 RepID=UPI0009E97706|nr:Sec-independent protein translocase protein TatB [Aureimonas sp. AU4]